MLVEQAFKHSKFLFADTPAKFEEMLMQEKTSEPNRIPYRLTILPDYPQYIMLGYIPKQLLKREFIKVKPKGYWFHEQYHKNIQYLIDFFKKNFADRDYMSYQKRQKSPRAR
jgi:hypothetical protein